MGASPEVIARSVASKCCCLLALSIMQFASLSGIVGIFVSSKILCCGNTTTQVRWDVRQHNAGSLLTTGRLLTTRWESPVAYHIPSCLPHPILPAQDRKRNAPCVRICSCLGLLLALGSAGGCLAISVQFLMPGIPALSSIDKCPTIATAPYGPQCPYNRRSLSDAQTGHFTPVGLLAKIPLYFAERDPKDAPEGLYNGTATWDKDAPANHQTGKLTFLLFRTSAAPLHRSK